MSVPHFRIFMRGKKGNQPLKKLCKTLLNDGLFPPETQQMLVLGALSENSITYGCIQKALLQQINSRALWRGYRCKIFCS